MKAILSAFITVWAFWATPLKAAPEDEITMTIEQVATPEAVRVEFGRMAVHPTGPTLEDAIDLKAIINIGKTVWTIIEENAPVVNIDYDYANALPLGVDSAGVLSGFSGLEYSSYRLAGVNGFGMTVYDVTYTLVHQYGGSYQGQGQYLATVAVIPSAVDVLWGYTVDFNVQNVSTVNVGTDAAPVGAVNLELSFSVKTVLKHHTSTVLYHFRGDSAEVESTEL